MRRRLLLPALLVFTVAAVACASSDGSIPASSGSSGESGTDPSTFAAQVASIDLWAGDPQDVQIGVFSATETEGVRLVTGGSIDVTFSPFGEEPSSSPAAEARYLEAPGTGGSEAGSPQLTSPDEARGVYQVDDAVFQEAGIWNAEIVFQIDDTPVTLQTQFEVHEAPRLPAPGQPALKTDSLTMTSDADPAAIDSRAAEDGEVPDPDLHEGSIAQAVKAGTPALVLFATPVYCQSQFCGPDVEWLEGFADERPGDAAYIHVEVWKDYQSQTLNEAASDWLLRDDELTEPWLYLIDARGTIVDRWGPLFDPTEVGDALDEVVADGG